MKTHYLLTTAAAALLLGTVAASAQTLQNVQPERAPAAQQNAPAEKVAPPMNAGERKKPETTGQASGSMEMKNKPETTGQAPKSDDRDSADRAAPKASDSGKPRAQDNEINRSDKQRGAAETKGSSDSKARAADDNKADVKKGQSRKSGDSADRDSDKSATSGQGTAGAAKLSTEQRTKITSVIKKQNVKRVSRTDINVNIRVGTRVPSRVHFYPVPIEVVEFYPEWRGYLFILVGDQIVIIAPDDHTIVAIIDA
jgi:hypothetical protein